jgi:hypothetical protein
MKPETRYLRWVVSVVLGAITITGALNWLVDPFSIFSAPAIARFNANKVDYVDYLRLTHVYRVERLKPECILLGTSRTGRGFSPDAPTLAKLNCYNLALPAISMYEMRRYLQDAESVHPLRRAVLSLDFRVFNAVPINSGAFVEQRLAVDSAGHRQFNLFSARLPDLASSLVSLPAIRASLKTVRRQGWVKDTLAPNGYWRPLANRYDQIAAFRAYTHNSMQRFEEMRRSEEIFSSATEEFRRLLREAYGRGIEAYLIIPPSHAWHWETLWLSGLWPRFEAMKRALVRINAEEAARAGHQAYPVWDFSGSYGPSLEPPARRGETMRWFWDPVHFKRALGDIVLERALSKADTTDPVHPTLGVCLNSANLERHLLRLRALQKDYEGTHPMDLAEIRTLMRQP